MEQAKECPMCRSAMKLIPAGTSKRTGKQYNSFWVCQNPNCKHIENIDSKTVAPKEPTWSPKILDTEWKAGVEKYLKLIHHNILVLNKKVNELITKGGDIPLIEEQENGEDVIDKNVLREL